MAHEKKPTIRVNLSNVQGEGAVQLVGSLLPAIDRQTLASLGRIDLPHRGALSTYRRQSIGPQPAVYRRYLPNALSRLVECLLPVAQDDPETAMLVLGDLPLRTRARQTVFVHTPHLLGRQQATLPTQQIKFAVMRKLFSLNLNHVAHVVVQTNLMRHQLILSYPELEDRVVVLRQPPPAWLLDHSRPERIFPPSRLRLFYPAARYPHKNHRLVEHLAHLPESGNIIASVALTIDRLQGTRAPLLNYMGRLEPEAMRRQYDEADALFFPSLAESYGLPLVEAMWLGLPIICADLPYARELCGDTAMYFDPLDANSACAAALRLRNLMASGWRPDWRRNLEQMPRNWDEVACRLVATTLS